MNIETIKIKLAFSVRFVYINPNYITSVTEIVDETTKKHLLMIELKTGSVYSVHDTYENKKLLGLER